MQERAQAAQKLRVRKRTRQAEIKEHVAAINEIPRAPEDWKAWLGEVLPDYFGGGFAKRHVDFWEWVWSIGPGDAPRPYVAVWPRGGGKSTGAEGAVVALGAPRFAGGASARRYVVYVRETQNQANDSVSNIRGMLESDRLGVYYPSLGRPRLGKFGQKQGWRRSRLITARVLAVQKAEMFHFLMNRSEASQRPYPVKWDPRVQVKRKGLETPLLKRYGQK